MKALSRGKVTLPSGYSIVSAIKWEAKKKKISKPPPHHLYWNEIYKEIYNEM